MPSSQHVVSGRSFNSLGLSFLICTGDQQQYVLLTAVRRTEKACVYKAPGTALAARRTWWVGLLLVKELRLYPGLQASVRAPCQGLPPSGSPGKGGVGRRKGRARTENERRKRKGKREEEEGSVQTGPGAPSMLTHLPGAPCHGSMWGLASEIPRVQEQPQGFHLNHLSPFQRHC